MDEKVTYRAGQTPSNPATASGEIELPRQRLPLGAFVRRGKIHLLTPMALPPHYDCSQCNERSTGRIATPAGNGTAARTTSRSCVTKKYNEKRSWPEDLGDRRAEEPMPRRRASEIEGPRLTKA